MSGVVIRRVRRARLQQRRLPPTFNLMSSTSVPAAWPTGADIDQMAANVGASVCLVRV